MMSKVEAIKERILGEIKAGKLKPGVVIPSRHQFMRRFGCARGSIDTAIGDLVKSGFLYSKQGSGTYVSEKTPSSDVEEICVIDNFDAYMVSQASGTSRLVSEIQRSMPCNLYGGKDLNIYLSRIARPGNAVIWIRPTYSQLHYMNYIADVGIPQLLIGRSYGNFDRIVTDPAESIREGMDWLVAKSGKNLAFVSETVKSDFPYIADRVIAFYESCVEKGILLRPDRLVFKDFNDYERDVRDSVDRLFKTADTPSGVFLSAIRSAVAFVNMTEAAGKVAGRDFNLLLFDYDSRLLNRSGVAMLRQRWEEMYEAAHDWAVGVNKNKKGFQLKIKTEFIEG